MEQKTSALQKNTIKLAVVVLHYGSPVLTNAVVAQLCRQTTAEEQQHIFVLDNAAPEAYIPAQENKHSAVCCIRLEENKYWTGALDFAWQHYAAQGYTHLWFLNNDISLIALPQNKKHSFISYTIQRLLWLERCCSKGLSPAGTTLQSPAIGIYSPSALKNPYHSQMVHNPAQQASFSTYIDGIAPLFSLACLQAINGTDAADNILGYGVDIWLCLRAKKAGWQVVVDHQNVIDHQYHSTAKNIAGFLTTAAHKENLFFQKRLGTDWKQKVLLFSAENCYI